MRILEHLEIIRSGAPFMKIVLFLWPTTPKPSLESAFSKSLIERLNFMVELNGMLHY